jgi:N-acetylglucosamine-6-sulfatase
MAAPVASVASSSRSGDSTDGWEVFFITDGALVTADAAFPETTIDSGPTGTTSNATPTFSFSSSEPDSSFECRLDSDPFAACSGPGASHTPSSPLADGPHSFEVRATDQAQNTDQSPASSEFTVDTAAPDPPQITDTDPDSPANDNDPELKGTLGAGDPTTVKLYENATCQGTPDATGTAAEFTGAGIAVTVPDDATTALSAQAADQVGNHSGCSDSFDYREDSSAPETTIDSGPTAVTNDPTPTFIVHPSEAGSTLRCRLDAGAYSTCTSPETTLPLTDGSHTFYVQATDPAGNTDPTPASLSFTVDTAPPNTTIIGGPSGATNNPTPAFTFSSSEAGSRLACKVDSSSYATCTSPKTTARLTDGSHTFYVQATDPAGNTDPTPASRSFTVRTTPNVLVIETDDQTVESMRVMDNVNSLIGDQGVTFRNSFVNYSLCCPSRATFLTGQYEHNHGVLGNEPPNGGSPRFESLHADNNLAVWLQNAGYYTAMIGKFLNRYSNNPPVPPGWSEWHAAAPNDQGVYSYTLNNNGTLVHYGQAPADFKQDVLTGKAVDFVNARAPKAQPFFLWLTYTAPHIGAPDPNPNPPGDCDGAAKPAPRHAHAFDSEPLPKLPNFNEADVSDKPPKIRNLPRLNADQVTDIQRKYRCELESLLSVDEGVKKIVDALTASGELSNTLLVFTSDNGYFHGEHRIPQDKTRIYEESIRVPLEMRGPGIPRGGSIGALAINADLAPTIVEVANAARPGLVMDGRSLIPVAQNPGIEQGRELLIEEPSFKAIRTGRYMYAEYSSGEKELYDLQKDPFELQSRHNDPVYALVKAQLATDLHKLQNCSGSSCRLHSAP